jgi:hypothetical protein
MQADYRGSASAAAADVACEVFVLVPEANGADAA